MQSDASFQRKNQGRLYMKGGQQVPPRGEKVMWLCSPPLVQDALLAFMADARSRQNQPYHQRCNVSIKREAQNTVYRSEKRCITCKNQQMQGESVAVELYGRGGRKISTRLALKYYRSYRSSNAVDEEHSAPIDLHE